jgi:hypothetical protein
MPRSAVLTDFSGQVVQRLILTRTCWLFQFIEACEH